MDTAIITMLEAYDCKTSTDYTNALKEIIQQVVLLGLWRAKFFEHTAFYGGTALRILYKLDRFSEDLDFSLLHPDPAFTLEPYHHAIISELQSLGFEVEINTKNKTKESAIHSAFLKANTKEHLLRIQAPDVIHKKFHINASLKIKIEIDTEPPPNFDVETIPVLNPIPFWVNSYTLPDLFAGKISAALCREWKTRVKGRDWYDFLWFIQKGIPVNLDHLEQRLRSVDYYTDESPLSLETLDTLLKNRITNLDITLAKKDMAIYIKDPTRLEGWSEHVFKAAVGQIKVR